MNVSCSNASSSFVANVPHRSLTTDWRLSSERKSNELLILLNRKKTEQNIKNTLSSQKRCMKRRSSYPKINIKMNMRHLHKSSICCFFFLALLSFFVYLCPQWFHTFLTSVNHVSQNALPNLENICQRPKIDGFSLKVMEQYSYRL